MLYIEKFFGAFSMSKYYHMRKWSLSFVFLDLLIKKN